MANITTNRLGEYSDVDFAFKANPNINNDVSIKREFAAVRQSVLNILRTNHGEKPFHPLFGANLRTFLFEPLDSITADSIIKNIVDALKNDEPRVEVVNIVVTDNQDENLIHVTLTVRLKSTSAVFDIESSLERLR
jgi:hypothetical protein